MNRNKECEKCSKFSHCNNNDLFCEKFINSELKTAKEENEKLKEQNKLFKGTIKKFNLDWYEKELDTLTQQNKQMMECLNEILKVFADKHSVNGYEHTTLTIVRNVLQALNQAKEGKE